MPDNIKKLDVLAFAAHPDDVELFCAGLLIKLKKQGYATGIVDLTRGELSTRGTIDTRAKETAEASRILALDIRENAGMDDGNITIDKASKVTVIEYIRKYRPQIVLAPYWQDRHPDHIATSNLVTEACFYSGVAKIKTESTVFRPKTVIYYFHHRVENPSFIVNIDAEFDEKVKAIQAYKSQFYNPDSKEAATYISTPQFMESVKNRAGYFGFQIGAKYGEPYYVKTALKVDNIIEMFA